ncbi:MAG: hypothetical protein IMF20_02340 [Proteobacteria bacterium]|nr:hypothetical protein [Pseudomonadota bacterium]
MALSLPKTCAMGSSQTALVGTIGVALLNPDGTVHTARATANIYEIGGGCYGKNIAFDDNWKGSLKWDTGGGTPVYAVEEYTIDGLVDAVIEDMDDIKGTGFVKDTDSLVDIRPDIADAVWDEVLTGASHNIPTSAGRRLRQSADVLIVREETCQAGGANDEVILDPGASAVDDFYLNDIIIFIGGTGINQSRHIDSYDGATKTAVVNRDWTTNPDATTDFVIRVDSTKHVHGLESEALDQVAGAIFTKIVEGTVTLEQLQRILLSFIGGKTSGGGTQDVRFRDNADSKARIHMAVDDNGNRNTVTLDGT